MKKITANLLLTFAFAFLSSGVILSSFMDIYSTGDLRATWLIIPMTLFFMVTVLINEIYAIPKLLLRQKYLAYCVFIAFISWTASTSGLLLEWYVRNLLFYPQRITDPHSPWILVDTLSNSILLILILFAIGGWQLYLKWSREADAERAIADRLDAYIKNVRERLNPRNIMRRLDDVSRLLKNDPGNVMKEIRTFSGELREQLYEIPVPPVNDEMQETDLKDYSVLTNFLVGSRYRLWRHIIFQILLLIISFGTFFDTPDHPEFADRFSGFIAMYLFMNLLAYINIFVLFGRFRRHRSVRRYCVEAGILIFASIMPIIITELATYDQNVYDKSLPAFMTLLSTGGTLFTLFFFVGGISAILINQDWIMGKRRISLLRAETARQEYAFLKKQINPHFLFNVLNNVGILSDDEPQESLRMLSELKRLLEYQFSETENAYTTPEKEIEFIRSYLALEQTRIENFSFTIESDLRQKNVRIPTLLFLPFVENAVKHGGTAAGIREVRISFATADGRLRFEAGNTVGPRREKKEGPGGLGISNTLRRLQLLYGDRFTYSREIMKDEYICSLQIPAETVRI